MLIKNRFKPCPHWRLSPNSATNWQQIRRQIVAVSVTIVASVDRTLKY